MQSIAVAIGQRLADFARVGDPARPGAGEVIDAVLTEPQCDDLVGTDRLANLAAGKLG